MTNIEHEELVICCMYSFSKFQFFFNSMGLFTKTKSKSHIIQNTQSISGRREPQLISFQHNTSSNSVKGLNSTRNGTR